MNRDQYHKLRSRIKTGHEVLSFCDRFALTVCIDGEFFTTGETAFEKKVREMLEIGDVPIADHIESPKDCELKLTIDFRNISDKEGTKYYQFSMQLTVSQLVKAFDSEETPILAIVWFDGIQGVGGGEDQKEINDGVMTLLLRFTKAYDDAHKR